MQNNKKYETLYFFLFGKFFILSVCKKIYAAGGKNMSYKLDIKDDALRICGLFGT